MKKAARKDANQAQLIADLRRLGASVSVLNGAGLPDLLVGHRRTNYLIEVKTARGVLTKPQCDFMATWAGAVYVVRNLTEARKVLGL
jgi:Holliday junction resolvase